MTNEGKLTSKYDKLKLSKGALTSPRVLFHVTSATVGTGKETRKFVGIGGGLVTEQSSPDQPSLQVQPRGVKRETLAVPKP